MAAPGSAASPATKPRTIARPRPATPGSNSSKTSATPRFISSEEIESGQLAKGTTPARVLVLPTAWALSDKEAAAIKTLLEPGLPTRTRIPNAVFADGPPGLFDSHGKLRAKSALADQFPFRLPAEMALAQGNSPTASSMAHDIARYGTAEGITASYLHWAGELIPFNPAVEVKPPVGGFLFALDPFQPSLFATTGEEIQGDVLQYLATQRPR